MKIPEGVSVQVGDGVVTVKGPKATLERKFDSKTVGVSTEGTEASVTLKKKDTRKNRSTVNSIEAHLKNMFEGSTGEFSKKLQIVYAHFPASIELKGSVVLIKNFLGEKVPRRANVIGSTKVVASGAEIIVSGHDKEAVGQTACNIVRATHIRHKDVRVFQDGIYYAEQ